MPKLLTIKEAANRLGVPVGSLRRAAEMHGFLIVMGRTVRLDEGDFPALIEACKHPKPAAQAPVGRPHVGETPIVVRATSAALGLDRLTHGVSLAKRK